MRIGTPNVEQLSVLLAVARAGSFAAAARQMGRATSGVSYAIDTLEAQLGLPLFNRTRTRKPSLTPAGEVIVCEAKLVLQSIDNLRGRVKNLLQGAESEVSLIIDSMVPHDLCLEALKAFYDRYSEVPLRLLVKTPSEVEPSIRRGDACIGVGGLRMSGRGLRQIGLGGIRVIPVAAPDHPLAIAPEREQARDHVQIVLSEDPSGDARDCGLLSHATWHVGDMIAKRKLLLRGIGWGSMPVPMIEADLEAGRLVALKLKDWRGEEYTVQVVYRINAPPGPAGLWLIDRLVAAFPGGMLHPEDLQEPRERGDVAIQ